MNRFDQYRNDNIEKSKQAKKEEAILAQWQENNIFQKTLQKESPQGTFVFYEGPPTANGRPGIHHLESRAFKDAIPRYKTMRGYHVRRKAGWDTHGLPVELGVEKQLGLSSKHEIESYGIAAFNQKCKESVWEYVSEWQDFTNRIGYWLDLDDPYVTYEPSYMETLWWVIKQAHNRDLLYQDYKVVPWCPRCGTGLSSHELAQGYKTVKDIAITAKFKVVGEENTYLLAWTTTPWTLPGNVALAVGEDIEYSSVNCDGETLICASDLVSDVCGDREYEVVDTYTGTDLIGTQYDPLFPYFSEHAKTTDIAGMEKAYQVYPADFVTTEDGTGIVHTAVMYGQDDFELGTAIGLPKYHLVTEEGTFVDETGMLSGRFVKEERDGKPTLDIDIIKYLQEHNLFFDKEAYEHTYPHCWRCDTPLIYYARHSWYINMSAIKETLISENEHITWEPDHIKDGRFGEWLRELKDWAISRERYWGTPLPIWHTDDGIRVVIGSKEELMKYSQPSNTYFSIRHGQSQSNQEGICESNGDPDNTLTDTGEQQVDEAIASLKDAGITTIYASPLPRTQQTAARIADALGVSVQTDDRLREVEWGTFEGKPIDEYFAWHKGVTDNLFTTPLPDGESFLDVKRRVGDFLYECEATHSGEVILIVSHGIVGELAPTVGLGLDKETSYQRRVEWAPANAEVQEIPFTPLPHNNDYELDLHRPYIDEVTLTTSTGKQLTRVPEVADVWFDSGAMPFAQDHYPFENKAYIDTDGFPADFICEAIDQTRGWFYTLHAVGNILGKGRAYENVISLGHILDEHGQKMSKSKGNVVDPWRATAEHGIDTLRFWMYSVNQPGESKNFDEETVAEVRRKVFDLLENVVTFYELYGAPTTVSSEESPSVLDQWLIARVHEVVAQATTHLDQYQLLEPTRAIRTLIGDLSQWYIRNSRERIKSQDGEAYAYACATTQYAVTTIAQLLAPFAPFVAEDVYGRISGAVESVHLTDWPAGGPVDQAVLDHMTSTRDVVTEALKIRQREGIKVRQPLAQLTITHDLPEAYRTLIAQQVNVKAVTVGETFALDCDIDESLARQGAVREIIRAIQAARKEAGLTPEQSIAIVVTTDAAGTELITDAADEIAAVAQVSDISFSETGEGETIQTRVAPVTISIKQG